MSYCTRTIFFFLMFAAGMQAETVTIMPESFVKVDAIIDGLFVNVSGYKISSEEKEAINKKVGGSASTYGEILFDSAQILLDDLNLDEDDVFYDLGSGAGKLVDQVYLTTPVKKAAGIELSETRYALAQARAPKIRKIAQLNDRFTQDIHDLLASLQEPAKKSSADKKEIAPHPVKQKKATHGKELQFINANMLETDLSDATVVFMCATCFSDELMDKITQKLAACKNGLRVLTLKELGKLETTENFDEQGKKHISSHLVPHENFKKIRTYTLPMSWSKSSGGSPVHLYELMPDVEETAADAAADMDSEDEADAV